MVKWVIICYGLLDNKKVTDIKLSPQLNLKRNIEDHYRPKIQ